MILDMKQIFIVWNFLPLMSGQHSKVSSLGARPILCHAEELVEGVVLGGGKKWPEVSDRCWFGFIVNQLGDLGNFLNPCDPL
jgi:hypothetical protein